MNCRLLASADLPSALDLAVVLVAEVGDPTAGVAAELEEAIRFAKGTGDLEGKFRSTGLFHQHGRKLRRLGSVGIGKPKELDGERLRRAAALAQQLAERSRVKKFALLIDQDRLADVDPEVAGRAVAEGVVLGAYRYQPPSRRKPEARSGQTCEVVFRGRARKAFAAGFRRGKAGAEATVLARDLANMAGNQLTPAEMARHARKLARGGVKVRVLERRDMERLKMGALLGVARGSAQPPKLIVLDWHPPKATRTVCVVGKGLTFDSGGISIKPAAKMEDMRYDMCGAAAVLGLFAAVGAGALTGARGRTRVVGVIAAAENMPDGAAQKPGDVVRACDGTTIEVLNTDAEGRLVLADALAWARKEFAPAKMVDLATLTGAVIVALGHEVAAVMGSDQALVEELIAAGKGADEPLWQLPMWEVHREMVKSKFADVANLAPATAGAGTIAGASFLSHFVDGTAWAHLDIAGTAWGGQAKDYYRSGAAGTAVRTLVEWVRAQG